MTQQPLLEGPHHVLDHGPLLARLLRGGVPRAEIMSCQQVSYFLTKHIDWASLVLFSILKFDLIISTT